jgi:hypothetical protein
MQEGKGLQVMGSGPFYGFGYCNICGTSEVVPVPVKFWSPDDGWVLGVLCNRCADMVRDRGPEEGDFAYRDADLKSRVLDIKVAFGDLDSAMISD